MVQRTGGRDRLAVTAAERGARREVACEQSALAQRAHCARVPSGQRAALGLHVAEASAGNGLGEGPRDRGELTMQRQYRDRPLQGQAQTLVLDGRNGVLNTRVIELHHTHIWRTVAGKSACEIDMHDVEPARAQAEIERLRVDHHLISRLGGADERDIGDRMT